MLISVAELSHFKYGVAHYETREANRWRARKNNFLLAMFEKIIEIGRKPRNLRLTVVPGIAIDRAWSN